MAQLNGPSLLNYSSFKDFHVTQWHFVFFHFSGTFLYPKGPFAPQPLQIAYEKICMPLYLTNLSIVQVYLRSMDFAPFAKYAIVSSSYQFLASVTVWHTWIYKDSVLVHSRSGRWPNKFFFLLSFVGKIIFGLSQSIWNLIFQCHTVTNSPGLRKSPLGGTPVAENPLSSFWKPP